MQLEIRNVLSLFLTCHAIKKELSFLRHMSFFSYRLSRSEEGSELAATSSDLVVTKKCFKNPELLFR